MAHRTTFEVPLRPLQGSRFQPTGFPDLGPALFQRPFRRTDSTTGWHDALLVESAQSMANHLEAAGWDAADSQPHPVLRSLPWVEVVAADDGRFLTSSRLESHRLAASFIKDSKLDGVSMKDVIRERLALKDNTPLAPRTIAAAVFALDPLCLLHGVFFAESAKVWPGQPRLARAVTAVVEAHDVKRAESGGVKRDAVAHSKGEGQDATGGYGSIPFGRTEWTAADIVLYAAIDDAQLVAYGLSEPATDLLSAVARWEIRSIIDNGLRLRTACDLGVIGEVDDLASAPSLDAEIAAIVSGGVPELPDAGLPLRVVWQSGSTTGKQ